jgi:hypothetical protein
VIITIPSLRTEQLKLLALIPEEEYKHIPGVIIRIPAVIDRTEYTNSAARECDGRTGRPLGHWVLSADLFSSKDEYISDVEFPPASLH